MACPPGMAGAEAAVSQCFGHRTRGMAEGLLQTQRPALLPGRAAPAECSQGGRGKWSLFAMDSVGAPNWQGDDYCGPNQGWSLLNFTTMSKLINVTGLVCLKVLAVLKYLVGQGIMGSLHLAGHRLGQASSWPSAKRVCPVRGCTSPQPSNAGHCLNHHIACTEANKNNNKVSRSQSSWLCKKLQSLKINLEFTSNLENKTNCRM